MENKQTCINCKWFDNYEKTCNVNPPQMFFNIEKMNSPAWVLPKVNENNFCSHFYFGR
jgi:hypothetical protein